MELYYLTLGDVKFTLSGADKFLDKFDLKYIFFFMNVSDPSLKVHFVLPPALRSCILLPVYEVLKIKGKRASKESLQNVKRRHELLFLRFPTLGHDHWTRIKTKYVTGKKRPKEIEAKISRTKYKFVESVYNKPSSLLLQDTQVITMLQDYDLSLVSYPHHINFRRQLIYAFGNKLKYYIRIKRNMCKFCPREYGKNMTSHNMKEHIKKMHTNRYKQVYPIKCNHESCDERFNKECWLKKHQIKKHSITD